MNDGKGPKMFDILSQLFVDASRNLVFRKFKLTKELTWCRAPSQVRAVLKRGEKLPASLRFQEQFYVIGFDHISKDLQSGHHKEQIADKVSDFLKWVDVSDKVKACPSQRSGSQKQYFAIA